MLHIALHFAVPALIALVWHNYSDDAWPNRAWQLYALMVATMVVDLDHLWADPIYDPGRCSIGFHPLHGLLPIGVYAVICAWPKMRAIGVGLLIHMALDSLDCYNNTGVWYSAV